MPVRYRSASGAARISVTQVLSMAGQIDASWYTPASASRGSAVHAWTEAYDRGDTLPSLDDHGYADAYAEFVGVARPVWQYVEHNVQSDTLRLAGRIDRVAAELFGRPGILDIKTGDPAAWHQLQTALYGLLCPVRGPRWALYLRPNGSYRLVPHRDPLDYRIALWHMSRVRDTVIPHGDLWIPR